VTQNLSELEGMSKAPHRIGTSEGTSSSRCGVTAAVVVEHTLGAVFTHNCSDARTRRDLRSVADYSISLRDGL
jgi:hypothetical protein